MLFVPGRCRAEPDHWQERWLRHFQTARSVADARWDDATLDARVDRVVAVVSAARRPAVVIAHDTGVSAVVHAAPRLVSTRLAGAFLVAPLIVPATTLGTVSIAARTQEATLPRHQLPFPARLLGGSNDPLCPLEEAQALGTAWGADVSIIAEAGHLDVESGHGPWPEGLLTLGLFLRKLGPVPGLA